ncbi:MAG: Amuc_1100 family pilus-like protein [Verrucomicrobiae bacterium]|nr:Amuc_1100 family pilus-like protein [Verrucomicrobiae bacterium]
MNIEWLKKNKLAATVIMLLVVVLVVVGWHLWTKYSAYREVQSRLDQALAQLQQLQNSNPTPTEENLARAEENFKQLQDAQRDLYRLLVRARLTPPAEIARPIEFATHVRKRVAAMEEEVKKAKILVPANFRFGFSRYTTTVPAKNLPRPKLDQLAKQLLVIEELTSLMIAAGVERIDTIKRSEIEPLPKGASMTEDGLPDPVTVHPEEHYVSMPFEVQVACTAESLRKLLNGIATSPRLLIVRVATIEQEVQRPGMEGSEPAETRRERAKETEEEAEPVQAIEKPPRLRVRLRLEFVEVLPPKQAARLTQ